MKQSKNHKYSLKTNIQHTIQANKYLADCQSFGHINTKSKITLFFLEAFPPPS